MDYKILPINKVDGLPVVPGADLVSVEGDFLIAYGPAVPGVNTKWMRGPDQVVAYLREWKPGYYIIVAEQDTLNILDPGNLGTDKDTTPGLVPEEHAKIIAGGNFAETMDVEPPVIIIDEEEEKK